MRTPVLAFLGAAFVIYWMLTDDPLQTRPSLGPVKPILAQVPNPPYDLIEPAGSGRAPAQTPTNLGTWLSEEAARMGQPDPDPEATKFRLREKAKGLKRSDLKKLKSVALDRAVSSDERFLAIYMLGLTGDERSLDLLREVSLAQIPGLPSERQHTDEVILRAHALEALVQKLDSKAAKAYLRDLLSRTGDPVLARHAQYWLRRLG